jgi:hypothetical protein
MMIVSDREGRGKGFVAEDAPALRARLARGEPITGLIPPEIHPLLVG